MENALDIKQLLKYTGVTQDGTAKNVIADNKDGIWYDADTDSYIFVGADAGFAYTSTGDKVHAILVHRGCTRDIDNDFDSRYDYIPVVGEVESNGEFMLCSIKKKYFDSSISRSTSPAIPVDDKATNFTPISRLGSSKVTDPILRTWYKKACGPDLEGSKQPQLGALGLAKSFRCLTTGRTSAVSGEDFLESFNKTRVEKSREYFLPKQELLEKSGKTVIDYLTKSRVNLTAGADDPINDYEIEQPWLAPPVPFVYTKREIVKAVWRDDFIRIGYVPFMLPPEQVIFTRDMPSKTVPLLRANGTLKERYGNSAKEFQIHIDTADPLTINEIVLPLIRQYQRTPFLPIINELINDTYDVDAIAIDGIQISTVPQFPGQLKVVIQAQEFNWHQYMPGEIHYDTTICYPLFQLWCETNTSTKPVKSTLDGSLQMSIPDEKTLEAIRLREERLTKSFRGSEQPSVDAKLISDTIRELSKEESELQMVSFGASSSRPFMPNVGESVYIRNARLNYWAPSFGNPDVDSSAPGSFLGGNTSTPIFLPNSASPSPLSDVYVFKIKDPHVARGLLTYIDGLEAKHPDYRKRFIIKGDLTVDSTSLGSAELPVYDLTTNNPNDKLYMASTLLKSENQSSEYFSGFTFVLPRNVVSEEKKATKDFRKALAPVVTKNKNADDEPIPEKWIPIPLPSFVIEDMTIGSESILAAQVPQSSDGPVHQFIGRADTHVILNGTIEQDDAKKLQQMLDKLEYLLKKYSGAQLGETKYEGYLKIENELCGLWGVEYALPARCTISTIPDFPELFSIQLTLVQFDPLQHKREEIQEYEAKLWGATILGQEVPGESKAAAKDNKAKNIGDIKNVKTKLGVDNRGDTIYNKVIRAERFNETLNTMELYPDMRLPTYEVVSQWVDLVCSATTLTNKTTIKVAKKERLLFNRGISTNVNRWPKSMLEELGSTDFAVPDRKGFVDPDFYCCSHYPKGNEFIHNMLNTLSNTSTRSDSDAEAVTQDLLDNRSVEKRTDIVVRDSYGTTATMPFFDVKADPSKGYTQEAFYFKDSEEARAAIEGWSSFGDELASSYGTNTGGTSDSNVDLTKLSSDISDYLAKNKEYAKYIAEVGEAGVYNAGALAAVFTKEKGVDDLLDEKGETIAYAFQINTDTMSSCVSAAKERSSKVPKRVLDLMNSGKDWRSDPEAVTWGAACLLDSRTAPLFRILEKQGINTSNPEIKSRLYGLGGSLSYISANPIQQGLKNLKNNLSKYNGNELAAYLEGQPLLSPTDPLQGVLGREAATAESIDAVAVRLIKSVKAYQNNNNKGSLVRRYKETTAASSQGVVVKDTEKNEGKISRLRIAQVDLSTGKVKVYNTDPENVTINGEDGTLSCTANGTSIYLRNSNETKRTVITKLYDGSKKVYWDAVAPEYREIYRKPGVYDTPLEHIEVVDYTKKMGFDFEAYRRAGKTPPSNPGNLVNFIVTDISAPIPKTCGRTQTEVAKFISAIGPQTVSEVMARNYKDPQYKSNKTQAYRPATAIEASKYSAGLLDSRVAVIVQEDGSLLVPTDQKETDASFQEKVDKNAPQFYSMSEMFIRQGEHQKNKWQDMFHDMRMYSNHNRLLNAYPTYCLLIVDGGKWFRFWRLFDYVYGITCVQGIEVFKSRKTPADVATLAFSNMYGHFARESNTSPAGRKFSWEMPQVVGAAQRLWSSFAGGLNVQDIGAWTGGNLGSVPENIATLWARNRLAMMIRPGARLHIRMGYGSAATRLPIVFNGAITEVTPGQDKLQLTALGDGIELLNQISAPGQTYKTYGLFGSSQPPREAIMKIMAPAKFLAVGTWGNYGAENPFGIEHFGTAQYGTNVESDRYGYNCLYNPSEIGMNVYEATKRSVHCDAAFANINSFVEGLSAINCIPAYGLYDDTKSNFHILLSMEGTAWDAVRNCERAVPEFIAGVVPFGLRSTLFYGKPYWPVRYDYKPGVVATNEYTGESEVEDDVTSSKNMDDITMWKPYSQIHVIASPYNLLDNKIRVSSEDMFTMCQAQGSLNTTFTAEGTIETSDTMYLDTDIFPEYQKKMFINSGQYATTWSKWQDVLLNINISSLVFNRIPLNNCAIKALRESVMDMYQGHCTIIGDPSIKPHDICYFLDSRIELSGVFKVKEVTHHFAPEVGMITTVSPDLAVSTSEFADDAVHMWTNNFGQKYVGTLAIQTVLAGFCANRINPKALWIKLLGRMSDLDMKYGAGTMNATIEELMGVLRGFGGKMTEELTEAAKWFSEGTAISYETGLALEGVATDAGPIRGWVGEHFVKEPVDALKRIADATNNVNYTRAEWSYKNTEKALEKLDLTAPEDSNIRRARQAIDEGLEELGKAQEKLKGGTSIVEQATLQEQIETQSRIVKENRAALEEYRAAATGDLGNKYRDAEKAIEEAFSKLDKAAKEISKEDKLLAKIFKGMGATIEKIRDSWKIEVDLANITRAAALASAGKYKEAETALSLVSLFGKRIGVAKTFIQIGPQLAIFMAIDCIGNWINRKLAARQCLVLRPLNICGQEFLAGVDGHLGCVVGDPIGTWDGIFECLTTPGYSIPKGQGVLGFGKWDEGQVNLKEGFKNTGLGILQLASTFLLGVKGANYHSGNTGDMDDYLLGRGPLTAEEKKKRKEAITNWYKEVWQGTVPADNLLPDGSGGGGIPSEAWNDPRTVNVGGQCGQYVIDYLHNNLGSGVATATEIRNWARKYKETDTTAFKNYNSSYSMGPVYVYQGNETLAAEAQINQLLTKSKYIIVDNDGLDSSEQHTAIAYKGTDGKIYLNENSSVYGPGGSYYGQGSFNEGKSYIGTARPFAKAFSGRMVRIIPVIPQSNT